MKQIKITYFAIISMALCFSCKTDTRVERPADYVNPFIGTDAHGHTYPGAAMPFGMVQLSPDTRLGGWDGASGYHYSDSVIYGFTHTALNGTGVGDYGDILLMPCIGEAALINTDYLSPFQKKNEKAIAGYYSVFLDKPGVLAELTTTTRVGYHRYTFPQSSEANIIIDLEHRDKVTDSWIEFVSETEIRGMRRSSNWANDMVWYFHMEFSKPFVRKGVALNNQLLHGENFTRGTNVKAFVGFETQHNEQVEVKVSLSAVDSEGAIKNLKAEIPDWGFDEVKQNAFNAWNDELSKIIVTGNSDDPKTVFYSALYHAFLQPNTFMDVDNRYRGIDKNIHSANGFTNYTVFSLWDTYRTWHPLMTIIEQKRTNDFVRVMLDMYEKGGLLPIWELAANETYCMIGNHSISVIADAFIKGVDDFDNEKALEAMIHSATREHYGLGAYQKYGHIPGDKEHESISKTLEYAYNDWCIAVMAKEMGYDEIYREYIKRAQYYKNIFDPESGFMRPRLNGGWLTPFDPTKVDWHFTEANSWQYSFYVPHDITGFYTLYGGKDILAAKIDELFDTDAKITGRDMKDITGLIGQYAHGNEPSHHMAYLYNFLNQPWKTQKRVRYIMDELYTNNPDGISGNEDCGQMSAWLIMSAMGFYPVTPGSPEYIIGTPWFPEMEIFLENGNIFKITANNVSKKNFYIQSATLNGTDYTKSYLSHRDIMSGGHLHFEMGSKPNIKWGSGDNDVPVSYISDELLLPIPFIMAEEQRIKDKMEVSINTIIADVDIYYTLDGTTPTIESEKYVEPFVLTSTKTLKAVAYKDGKYSFPVQADFVKIDINRSIEIKSQWSPSYHAGGPEALIDGVRGASNWRLGGWHGYQATDFEAIVDLGKIQPINYLAAGFIQDIRSWIWMPKDVTFFVSKDGDAFTQVAKILNKIPSDDYDIYQEDLKANVNTSARFIKVKATNYGKIPHWHLGAGGNAFIFIDEIIIN
ncbi:MAG: GH92 family glycosyl hydrolase [Bacteroidetes bacterium]|nr:GH92 family glycosyl hydrolase [Bacteroidota bacterium]